MWASFVKAEGCGSELIERGIIERQVSSHKGPRGFDLSPAAAARLFSIVL
jgi:hypothetical protein